MKLLQSLREASRQSGRSMVDVGAEMVRLRFGRGRLGVSEYVDFRLYESDLTPEQRQGFGGYRGQRILEELLVDDYSQMLSLDKVLMYTVMAGFGLAVPGTMALYGARWPSAAPQLRSPDELAEFLRARAPAYIKPALGSYGKENVLVQAVDGREVVLGNGNRRDLDEFCHSLSSRFGWIIQEPLRPHPAIAERCGSKISGVRVHTFMLDSGPQLFRAMWKANVGREDSDNFRHGKSGNMLGAVDLETGCITRVVSGIGPRQQVDVPHPSGIDLKGFVLPCWAQVRQLVLDAHLAFRGYICPGWDVAICPDGPKILEVNAFGDIDLSQHAHRKGFIDEQMMALLEQRGIATLLTGSSKLKSRNRLTGRHGRRKAHWAW